MMVTVDIEISNTREAVWGAIADIENSDSMISSILKINILHKPSDDIVGLKWEETRKMYGKKAQETMWITDSLENEYYCTRAESHGSVYITRLTLSEGVKGTLLTMSFTGIAQTFGTKLMSFFMGPLIKGSIRKALNKDLEDIKVFVEKR